MNVITTEKGIMDMVDINMMVDGRILLVYLKMNTGLTKILPIYNWAVKKDFLCMTLKKNIQMQR